MREVNTDGGCFFGRSTPWTIIYWTMLLDHELLDHELLDHELLDHELLDHDPVGHYVMKWRYLPLSNPACHRLVSDRQPGQAGCMKSSTTAIG